MRKQSLYFILFMSIFTILALFFILTIGQDSLDGKNSFQFYSDSNTYIQAYKEAATGLDSSLVTVNNNFLGPLTILWLLQGNSYLVILLNVYIFTHSIIFITGKLNINTLEVGLLLLMSPIAISSLLSVNKEIIIFPFLAFGLCAYMRKSIFFTLIALILSIMVRWQLTIYYLLILLLSFNQRLVRFKSRVTVLITLLLGISITYMIIQPLIEPVIAYANLSFENYEVDGSGLFELMLSFQNKGYYIFAFPIKAFHLLFGMGFKIDKIFSPQDIYNDIFIGLHCAVAFIVFILLFKRRLFTIQNDLIYASIIFLTIFCVTPMFTPRYLFFVFILWVLVLAGAPNALTRLKKNNQFKHDTM